GRSAERPLSASGSVTGRVTGLGPSAAGFELGWIASRAGGVLTAGFGGEITGFGAEGSGFGAGDVTGLGPPGVDAPDEDAGGETNAK
ncbi:MAG: hypothetical protein SGJ11_12725, partial [Phycisphaerae bacterium]|nr:hypothetical protein [Phycisphaerae bacterium]